jgi:hypothetical protein
MPGSVEPVGMAQSVPLFRLVMVVLVAGGVAGYGAVLFAPRLGIEGLADVEPFVAGVAGGVAALGTWLVGALLAVTVVEGVVDGLVQVLVVGYVLVAAPLAVAAGVAARRRVGGDDVDGALARWVGLSVAGFAVVGAVTVGLGALALSF